MGHRQRQKEVKRGFKELIRIWHFIIGLQCQLTLALKSCHTLGNPFQLCDNA